MKINRHYIHPRKKNTIKKINNFTCHICKEQKTSDELEIDHLVPLSDGGTNDFSNLSPICIECHIKKSREESINYSNEVNNEVNNKNLSIYEKLKLLEDFLIENKDYSYIEIQFLVLNHPILSKFNYNSTILFNLFNKVNKIQKEVGGNQKYRKQRDILIYILKKEEEMTFRKMEEFLVKYGFNISSPQIAAICKKFDKSVKLIEEK